jgi:hypothetical protein
MKKIYGVLMAAVASLAIVAVAQAQTVFNVDPVKGAQVLQVILSGNFASQPAATNSSLTITGSRFNSVNQKTGSFAAVAGASYFCNTTATATLPTAVGILGQEVYIKNTNGSSLVVTMASTSSQTINGGAAGSTTIAAGAAKGFVSDGANWVSL